MASYVMDGAGTAMSQDPTLPESEREYGNNLAVAAIFPLAIAQGIFSAAGSIKPILYKNSMMGDLAGLEKGNNSGVKLAESEAQMRSYYEKWTKGGKPSTWPDYNGLAMELPNGTQVGYRLDSSDGGPTIDIRFPYGTRWKVHIK
jgi:hypothetical protein